MAKDKRYTSAVSGRIDHPIDQETPVTILYQSWKVIARKVLSVAIETVKLTIKTIQLTIEIVQFTIKIIQLTIKIVQFTIKIVHLVINWTLPKEYLPNSQDTKNRNQSKFKITSTFISRCKKRLTQRLKGIQTRFGNT